MQAEVAKNYKFLAEDASTIAYLETKERERIARAAEAREAQRRRARMHSLLDEGGRLARLLDRVQLSQKYDAATLPHRGNVCSAISPRGRCPVSKRPGNAQAASTFRRTTGPR